MIDEPLDLSKVAVTACVEPNGDLKPVRYEYKKLIAAYLERFPPLSAVVVAALQTLDTSGFQRDETYEQIWRLSDPDRIFCLIKATSVRDAARLLSLCHLRHLGGTPPPNYGFPDKASPAVPIVILREARDAGTRSQQGDGETGPFDLGTAWGLDRGGFVGLLAGEPDDEAYESLVMAEQAIWDAGHKDPAARLPIRYWLKFDCGTQAPRPPISDGALWDANSDPASLRVSALRHSGDKRDLVRVGVFLEFDAAALAADDLHAVSEAATIREWCSRVMHGLFRPWQAAIVVHLCGLPSRHVIPTLNKLRHRISNGDRERLACPVVAGFWVGATKSQRAEAEAGAANDVTRRGSLLKACHNPTLMSSWLRGTNFEASRFVSPPGLLWSDDKVGCVADAVILALLSFCHNAPPADVEREKAIGMMKSILPVAGWTVGGLVKAWLSDSCTQPPGEMQMKAWLRASADEELRLCLGAGLGGGVELARRLASRTVADPDIWRNVFAEQPVTDVVTCLAAARHGLNGIPVSLVFGLLDHTDFDALRGDQTVVDQVVACRWGRPLCCHGPKFKED